MANVKISELPTDSALTGAELLTGIEGSTNQNVSVQQIADFTEAQIGGGGGSSTFAGLTDAATANIPVINSPTAAALAAKAPLASPTFTGTVSGITKAMVGLSNVDNTTDAGKPVSTAQAAADAAVQAAAIQRANHTGTQAASTISGGTFDGDLLPAISATKKGGVPATGTPSGKFLKDDNTWATPAGGGGGASAYGDLTDATTVDLPTVNNPLEAALALKADTANLPIKNFVTDFGGVGDGVTDNTAAFEAVMAEDCTQFILFIPGGHYKTHTVTLNLHLNIIGTGLNTGVNVPPVTQVYGAVISPIGAETIFKTAHDIPTTWYPGRIEGIQFEGNNLGTIGLDVGGTQAYCIYRNGFQNFTQAGIKSYGSLGCEIDGNAFFNNQYDIDLDDDGSMPPNLIMIKNNRFWYSKKYSIRARGDLSMLEIHDNNFSLPGTIGDVNSGLLDFSTGHEGIGFDFSRNYVEGTEGFASIKIGPAFSADVRYIIENNQFNAPGGALHDIYVDASGTHKQRVYIANSLIRNAGGLTVSGSNATLIIVNSTIPVRTIPSDVPIVEIDDMGNVLKNGLPLESILPSYTNTEIAAFNTTPRIFMNSDEGIPQIWDGASQFDIGITPYTPPTTILFDDFNRANNASSLGNTITPGTAWPSPVSGVWGIISNLAYNSDTVGFGHVVYDLAVSDFTLIANATREATTNSRGGLLFRYQDASNWWYLEMRSGDVILYKSVAGSGSQVGATYTISNPPYTVRNLKVRTNGNIIKCYVDGVEILNITDSHLATETKVGMVSGQASDPFFFEDITATG